MSDISRFYNEVYNEEYIVSLAERVTHDGFSRKIEFYPLQREQVIRCADCGYAREYSSIEGTRCLRWFDDSGLPAKVDSDGFCWCGKPRRA